MSLNFAHRGFSGKYPENTMLAFEQAVDAGCDGIELDVQLTKDGKVVIIHDETVDRTTNGTGEVVDFTYNQLKRLDAFGKFKGKYNAQRIPLLREYFDFVKETDVITNIELKNSINTYPGMEEKVLKLICEYGLEEKVIMSSFNHYSMVTFKKMAPQIKCGFLEESWVIGFARYAKRYGMDFVHPMFHMVTDEFVEEAKQYGIGINAWTLKKEIDIEDMMKKGIHGVISDFPDMSAKVKSKI